MSSARLNAKVSWLKMVNKNNIITRVHRERRRAIDAIFVLVVSIISSGQSKSPPAGEIPKLVVAKSY